MVVQFEASTPVFTVEHTPADGHYLVSPLLSTQEKQRNKKKKHILGFESICAMSGSDVHSLPTGALIPRVKLPPSSFQSVMQCSELTFAVCCGQVDRTCAKLVPPPTAEQSGALVLCPGQPSSSDLPSRSISA
eukprot:3247981-Rhodomonas_salina.1